MEANEAMDKQDELAAVIGRAFDDYNASVFAVSLPYDVRRAGTIQAIADGVRSSILASGVVELIARAMAGAEADEQSAYAGLEQPPRFLTTESVAHITGTKLPSPTWATYSTAA